MAVGSSSDWRPDHFPFVIFDFSFFILFVTDQLLLLAQKDMGWRKRSAMKAMTNEKCEMTNGKWFAVKAPAAPLQTSLTHARNQENSDI